MYFHKSLLQKVFFIFSLSLIFSVQATTDCAVQTDIPQAECEDLIALYDSTDGDNWTDNTGWKVTNSPCSWSRITCSGGSVIEIKLSNNQLKGSIPDFSALTNLQYLSLWTNQLKGSIPDFSALTNLQHLSLWNNQLTGSIPDFSALSNLQWLRLSSNQLTGRIPNFSALSNLQVLYLNNNQLTGRIPDFSTLSNLRGLYLENNQLTGRIPDLSALVSLENLSLSNNQLTGSIPDLSTLTNLQYLSLYGNSLCKDTAIDYSPWAINSSFWNVDSESNTYPTCTNTNNPPSANFTLSKTGFYDFTFNSTSIDDGSIIKYDWYINGTLLTSLDSNTPVSYIFSDGQHTIKLTVTDNDGLIASAEHEIILMGNPDWVPVDVSNNQPPQCSEKECNYSIQIDQPGFYVATVNLPEGSKEGLWGVEFKTSGGINTGGFNSGAILKEDGDRPGFMGFYLSQAESVNITPYEYTGAVDQMKIQVSLGDRTVIFDPEISASGQMHATPVLEPGFYVAEAFSESESPRGRFGFEVSAESMSGGVNIGGWIDSYTGGGFGGLYIAKSQTVDVNVFFGESYSSIGSDYVELNVYRQENGERILVFSGTQ